MTLLIEFRLIDLIVGSNVANNISLAKTFAPVRVLNKVDFPALV